MQLKNAELIRVNNVLYVNSFPANGHALVILVYDLYVTIKIDTNQDIHVLQVLF